MSERSYLDLMDRVAGYGHVRQDRTGTGTRALFAKHLSFDLLYGFPILTTKKIFFRGVAEELFWFLSGDTNSRTLEVKGINIWKEWADENGELGPIYGEAWRAWDYNEEYESSTDQISNLIEGLRDDPFSRRHVATAWNPSDRHRWALPPCHILFQCLVGEHRELTLHVYQRSADMFLGVPFNIASYALLAHMIAQQTDLIASELVFSYGDLHVYNNHKEQVSTQLRRNIRPPPQLTLRKKPSIFDYDWDDVSLTGYDPHPSIEAPVAV